MKSDIGCKKLKKPKSVNRTVIGYFCVLAFLMVFLVELGFLILVSETLENQARDKIYIIGKEFEANLQSGEDTAAIEESIARNRVEGINVYLFTEGGDLVAPDGYGDVNEVLTELTSRVGNEEVGYHTTYRSGNTVNYASKTEYAGKTHYLLVSYSVTIVRDTVLNLQLYLLIIGCGVFAAAVLVSFGFSKKLTSGMKTMSDTAVLLAEGNYDIKFTNADYKEMAQLSDALNYVRDEVKKSEDFQHEILANVTHDLKTPLTMIKAYASMIKEISGNNPEKREKHLQVIIDEADRLTGLVNDVLSVSKLQANMSELKLKVFNLTDLVYGIINKFGYLQEAQGYSFMLDIEPNIYTRADEEKISQVIYNLLGNAANYTGEDKTVYISLKTNMDGKRVRFSVKDTGKGISKDDLPEIWNRFYRVKENHNRPVKGTGLGLNIVKAILENHAFDFGVESEVNKGSLFWVDFPCVPAEIEI
ncbi:MAG: HAMP domain-containing histidine kinase [Clostridia bacterium]|nr:HAMP domain-containing histidine kinase [Clostridia bacterium]